MTLFFPGLRNKPNAAMGATLGLLVLLLALPFIVGTTTGGNAGVRALAFAALYVMLALGLNSVVGFAGLLDLGYIAFYAVGAYMYALLASPHAQDAAWDFLRERWSAVTDKVGAFQGMPYLVTSLGAFCSAARADEVTAFFAAHLAPEAARALRQATERITACAAVDARQSPALSRWLEAQRSEK